MNTPRIALISAVTAAIPPADAALTEAFGQVRVWNLLDDRLLSDADARGGLDDGLRARMNRLIEHALAEGADAVLLTCSLYGPVAQAFSSQKPVLAPDEAAFADLARSGYGRILVVASFDAAKDDSVDRLSGALATAGGDAAVTGLAVPEAMAATKAQDTDRLVSALVDACRPLASELDAVFLAQYSLAPAGRRLQEAIGIPVVSGPASSAAALHRHLTQEPTP